MNQNHNKSKLIIYYPIMLAAMLVLGIYLGSFFSDSSQQGSFLTPRSVNPSDKISQIINFIDNAYVDSVERNELIEKAIGAILKDLDPHSYYISAEELAAYTEPLEGNFEGIGIEFLVQNDTVRVVAAVEGGPSATLGIQAGDRIVAVDGVNIAGVDISNEDVVKKLKGPGGTVVAVEILRRGEKIAFEITRGTIPLNSVVTAQMLDETKGFIKVSRFARTTYDEFMHHLAILEGQGMKELILDLRGNGGGYLNAAVKMSEEFLQKGQLIVYTEGKASPRKSYYAEKKGKYSNLPVAVLINEGSASASEILAGAIQDNDRGLIVGRRSFGKGLVQEHMSLRDESALRLTVARYFTPSGRSIQKPYGSEIEYEDDYEVRLAHGEFVSADSVQFNDSLKYTTPGGRTVYGGGGIMPDIFVGLDTVGASGYLSMVSYEGLINQFGYDYADAHRDELNTYKSYEKFGTDFVIEDDVFEAFTNFAETAGIAKDPDGISRSEDVLKIRIKAYIARNIWGNDGFYSVMNTDDNVLKEAQMALSSNSSTSVTNTAYR
jgi:carboxyl-terminal processing protease